MVQSYSDPTSKFEIDFVPLRLEDAFNEAWWKTVGGKNLSRAARELGVDISDESASKPHIHTNLKAHPF